MRDGGAEKPGKHAWDGRREGGMRAAHLKRLWGPTREGSGIIAVAFRVLAAVAEGLRKAQRLTPRVAHLISVLQTS